MRVLRPLPDRAIHTHARAIDDTAASSAHVHASDPHTIDTARTPRFAARPFPTYSAASHGMLAFRGMHTVQGTRVVSRPTLPPHDGSRLLAYSAAQPSRPHAADTHRTVQPHGMLTYAPTTPGYIGRRSDAPHVASPRTLWPCDSAYALPPRASGRFLSTTFSEALAPLHWLRAGAVLSLTPPLPDLRGASTRRPGHARSRRGHPYDSDSLSLVMPECTRSSRDNMYAVVQLSRRASVDGGWSWRG